MPPPMTAPHEVRLTCPISPGGRWARRQSAPNNGNLLGGNPHGIPVLDHSDRDDWFVMPLARGYRRDRAVTADRVARLRELVAAICAALRPAHEADEAPGKPGEGLAGILQAAGALGPGTLFV